jgi:hypothetical protein
MTRASPALTVAAMTTTHANRTLLRLAGGGCIVGAAMLAVAVYGLCFVAVGIVLATGQRRALSTTRAEAQQA